MPKFKEKARSTCHSRGGPKRAARRQRGCPGYGELTIIPAAAAAAGGGEERLTVPPAPLPDLLTALPSCRSSMCFASAGKSRKAWGPPNEAGRWLAVTSDRPAVLQ